MKNNKILIISVIIISVCLLIGSTYAYLQIGNPSNQLEGTAGCFVVDYVGEQGQYISSDNKLESSSNYTSGGSSYVTLSKNENCQIYSEADIYLNTNATGTSSDLLTENALKYTVVDNTNTEIASGSITTTGPKKLTTIELTNTPTKYTIYIWIDNNITYNSDKVYDGLTYSGYIYATSQQESTYNE